MSKHKSWRRLKFAIWVVAGLVAVLWLAGDFAYSRVVSWRVRKWEASIARDNNGVREGCSDYTLGKGGRVILLIHGINDSPAAYHKMAPVLAEAGFACRVMRLPGFAEPLASYARTTRSSWLQCVDAEINSLRQQHREVNVVAHSLGGAVAIAYLSDHPQAVRKAVLIAPAVEVSDRRSPFFGARTWHSMSKRMLLFSRTTESTFPIDAHGVDDTQFPWRCPFTPLSVFEETFALIDENRGREGKFETPLLMVLSRDDQVVDWNAAERFYQSAATKEKQLFFTRDSGHAIPVDNDWRTVTSRIVEFLRDAPAPRNRSSD